MFRLPDLDGTYIPVPEDCIDSSDLDQYLPGENSHLYQSGAPYAQTYLKSAGLDEEESNNNHHKSKRLCPEAPSAQESYEDGLPSPFVRYHELQPSGSSAVKSERFLPPSTYGYQSAGVPIAPGGSYYPANASQYLPSYQYLPQRGGVFGNPAALGNYGGAEGNGAESWGHY